MSIFTAMVYYKGLLIEPVLHNQTFSSYYAHTDTVTVNSPSTSAAMSNMSPLTL